MILEESSFQSSCIGAIGYNTENEELYVRFLESGTYTYYDVPEYVYEAFISAPSKGQFFNSEVEPVYGFEKGGSI